MTTLAAVDTIAIKHLLMGGIAALKGSSVDRHMRIAFSALAALGALVLSGSAGSADTGLSPTLNGIHVMWQQGAASAPSPNNLIYHGGLVETTPSTYLVYWGPEWQAGFSKTVPVSASSSQTITYTSKTVENYLNTFFNNVGGSSYSNIQTQYCQNATPLITSCAGQPFAQYVTNPKSQLKGIWIDPSPVPSEIVTTGLAENTTADPIEQEAINAASHFGYDINATYFILTQPGTQATAYGSVYCAYHAETPHTTGHGVRYAFMPYVMDYASGCGENSVNATNDKFGNGYLDGYSIVAGHEWAEAITDPDNLNGTQDGWNDATTSENGDKCAWTNLQNITLGNHSFAIQPLWSNEANSGQGACVASR
jgi:serine protease